MFLETKHRRRIVHQDARVEYEQPGSYDLFSDHEALGVSGVDRQVQKETLGCDRRRQCRRRDVTPSRSVTPRRGHIEALAEGRSWMTVSDAATHSATRRVGAGPISEVQRIYRAWRWQMAAAGRGHQALTGSSTASRL